MERLKAKLRKIESAVEQKDTPNNVIIYDSKIEGDKDRRAKEFYKKYPDFDGVLFLLPKKDGEDE